MTSAARQLTKAKTRVAVVGTGPAGFGVLSALLDRPNDLDITLFEIGKPVHHIPFTGEPSKNSVRSYYDQVYSEIRSKNQFKFPPPKTHFAAGIPKYPLDGIPRIFKSQSFGGLSNYWGAGALPFGEAEFAAWPIDRTDIDPYYGKIADIMHIAGRKDRLNEYYGNDFISRPPLQLTQVMSKLDSTVNLAPKKFATYEILSGINRCAVETREDHPRRCHYCGECLAGCFNSSIFNTEYKIRKYMHDDRVSTVLGQVRCVNIEGGSLEVLINGQTETFSGFSKIYLAAGCPNTTAIMQRSLGLKEVEPMADNAVFVFPILYFGAVGSKGYNEPYSSLCNLIWGIKPRNSDQQFAQASIYMNFDYMWRYNIPGWMWPVVRPLFNYGRGRLFWARLYTHGQDSQAYRITLKNDEPIFTYARQADASVAADMMQSIRGVVNRKGFYIPPIAPILQKTNSHYAATLPMGGSRVPVSRHGEILPNVYLCDSSSFPDLPAVSLTFTIMAHAHRIAAETHES